MPVTNAGGGVAAGTVAHFAAATAPSGWIKANGAAISRAIYAKLFTAIGTTYGGGNGSTTFNVPDLRGEFVRGIDDGRGVDSGRGFGTTQGHAIPNITGGFDLPANTGQFYAYQNGVFSVSAGPITGPVLNSSQGTVNRVTLNISGQVQIANESRPRNVAMMACIKY